MKKRPLTASRLRLVLALSLFIISIAGAITFYFFNDQLDSFATEVSHTTADANASQTTIQTLQKIEKELQINREVVQRASSIVADSQSYEYQDQIITDLNDYAAKAGISITNLDFSASGTAESDTTPETQPGLAGVNSTSVLVTIKNPVIYNNLLQFINSIEQNLTKMQISKVGLTSDPSGSVSSEVLTIEVYIK